MAATASLKLTVDDYLALPEDGRRYQLIDGDLVMAPAPLRYHQRILLGSVMRSWITWTARRVENSISLPSTSTWTSTASSSPTSAGFPRNAAIFTHAGVQRAPPDWVIEVLSESTARLDRITKREPYAKFGVKELWLIDPESDLSECYLLQDDPSQPEGIYRLGEHETIATACLPELALRLDSFLGESK
jgi:Uma2 family endonuclease